MEIEVQWEFSDPDDAANRAYPNPLTGFSKHTASYEFERGKVSYREDDRLEYIAKAEADWISTFETRKQAVRNAIKLLSSLDQSIIGRLVVNTNEE